MTDGKKIMRRVAGYHDIRLDGMTDLVSRARGASVLDIGCNRGMVGFELASNGAQIVHGCDHYEEGIKTAREVFADMRAVQSLFAVVDLAKGPGVLKPIFRPVYDIVLMLATYHKLKRIMPKDDLTTLMLYLGGITAQYFAWRGTSDKPADNEEEIANLDRDLGRAGLARIHTSYISEELGVAAIWARG
jgi:SAM-dependent methyltransferase